MNLSMNEFPASIDVYPFRELVSDVLSPVALGTLEQLTSQILDIYGLEQLLDTPMPAALRAEHAERLVGRVRRIIRMLPPDISPLPNEVFTAVEFLVHEVRGEPVHLGQAILRLEFLAEEIRSRPLLHDLIMGRAN
jgi:hypothetical protein